MNGGYFSFPSSRNFQTAVHGPNPPYSLFFFYKSILKQNNAYEFVYMAAFVIMAEVSTCYRGHMVCKGINLALCRKSLLLLL